jgi:hypothetical protein
VIINIAVYLSYLVLFLNALLTLIFNITHEKNYNILLYFISLAILSLCYALFLLETFHADEIEFIKKNQNFILSSAIQLFHLSIILIIYVVWFIEEVISKSSIILLLGVQPLMTSILSIIMSN